MLEDFFTHDFFSPHTAVSRKNTTEEEYNIVSSSQVRLVVRICQTQSMRWGPEADKHSHDTEKIPGTLGHVLLLNTHEN